MNDERTILHLNADRPVESVEQDRLGRGPFCKDLATAIQQWRRPDCLVIGIDGPWGSGKSSVKNMILEHLRKAETRPTVVEFNPWYWSGQDRLLAAFFEEIGAALGQRNDGEANKLLARKWKAYSTRLALGGSVLAQIASVAGSAGAPPWLSGVLGLLAGSAVATGELANKTSDVHSASAAEAESTLEQLKQSVASQLIDGEESILVVIDDVDRLTAEEIRLLIRLVKANADFPRMIYLLLYDRSIVESALNEDTAGRGRNYLEKIVQIPFSLPALDETAIQNALFDGIGEIAGRQPLLHDLDNRSYRIYDWGVRPFFRTLRDVNRFLSTLSFHSGLFRANDINIADLCTVEVLRVFEPVVHRHLSQHKDLLLSGFDEWGTGERYGDWRKERLLELDMLVAMASEPNRGLVKTLLKLTFPQVDALSDGVRLTGSGFTNDLRDRRIHRKDMFDRYITFVIPTSEVPHVTVQALLDSLGDVQSLEPLFRRLHSERRLARALTLLHSHLDWPQAEQLTSLAAALFNSCDEVSDDEDAEPEWIGAIAEPLEAIFGLESDPVKRDEALLKAFTTSSGLRLPVFFIKAQFVPGTINPNSDRFKAETLSAARELCCMRISEFARQSRASLPQIAAHLRLWREWSNGSDLDEWLAESLKTSANAFLLACGLSRRKQHGMPVYLHLGDLYAVSENPIWIESLRQFVREPMETEHIDLASAFPKSFEAIRSAIAQPPNGNP